MQISAQFHLVMSHVQFWARPIRSLKAAICLHRDDLSFSKSQMSGRHPQYFSSIGVLEPVTLSSQGPGPPCASLRNSKDLVIGLSSLSSLQPKNDCRIAEHCDDFWTHWNDVLLDDKGLLSPLWAPGHLPKQKGENSERRRKKK